MCVLFSVQTVHNTMCGYGMQMQKEDLASKNIFTVGCLEKILWWAKNNLRLVGGLTAGLLLLEVASLSTPEDFVLVIVKKGMVNLCLYPAAGVHDVIGYRSDILDQESSEENRGQHSWETNGEEG